LPPERGAEPSLNLNHDTELVRGSGNVFRDFGDPKPEFEQLRYILAAQIIKTLGVRISISGPR
jgi:hypothetical protein